MIRADGRAANALRPMSVQIDFVKTALASALIRAGDTMVLCTASLDSVPGWLRHADPPRGWVTAEYAMLPGSGNDRVPRERKGAKGRTQEIQRLIGRSLRAVVDLEALGPRSITIDCDVLQADGGTRTASITGGFVVLALALGRLYERGELERHPLSGSVAAVSCGVVDGHPVLDLPYVEDSAADVDMNVVMTGAGALIEVQGTGEGSTFTRAELNDLLDLAAHGVRQITTLQREALPEGAFYDVIFEPQP